MNPTYTYIKIHRNSKLAEKWIFSLEQGSWIGTAPNAIGAIGAGCHTTARPGLQWLYEAFQRPLLRDQIHLLWRDRHDLTLSQVLYHTVMSWDDLRYVLEISRHRTLSGAADALGVTRTTVGRRLKVLQAQLGARLFDRTPEGLLPTPAGDELAAAAERMESHALAAAGKVMGKDARLTGKLCVSTLDFIFSGFRDVFTSFMQRYPSVELTLTTPNEAVSLTRREADVVVRLGNAPPDYLVGRRLGRIMFAVYASRDLVDRVGEDAGLGSYPWVGWDERRDSRWLVAWLEENAPGAELIIRIDSFWVMRDLISGGIGVHFMPCFMADRDPDLVRISDIQAQFGRDLWALTMPELRDTSRVRTFMDHVVEGMKAHADRLAGHIAPAPGGP